MPVIDATGMGSSVKIWTNNVEGGTVTVDGFEIKGAGIFARQGTSSVTRTGIEITNNYIHNAETGFNVWGFGGFSEYGNTVADISVEGNEFSDLGTEGTTSGTGVLLEELANDSTASGFAATVKDNT